jgi:hypothetical protein
MVGASLVEILGRLLGMELGFALGESLAIVLGEGLGALEGWSLCFEGSKDGSSEGFSLEATLGFELGE